jgi:hypothetical protein
MLQLLSMLKSFEKMKISKNKLRGFISERFSSEDFKDVYATARMAHTGQKRRSGEDYFSHPSEVRNIVARFYPKDRVSQLAALLHDSLEDAPGLTVDSVEEMEEYIRGSISDPHSAQEVIRVVRALTHEKGGDYLSYVTRLIGDVPTLRVKLADMVHNLSSSPSPKQKNKYRSAIQSISSQTGGQIPDGISSNHWKHLHTLTESKKMKITKKQLKRIIKEEAVSLHEMNSFNQEVREAYCEHILLNYPNLLLAEGYISKEAYTRAYKMRMLNEANGINKKLEEGFFDDVKAMAKKAGGAAMAKGKELGGKALEKGKEAGKAGLAKAKEIGDTEIDVKGARKEMGRVGAEAGELAAGAGEAMLNFIGPMAKKLGDKANKFAQKKLKQIDKQGPKALAAVSKHIESGVNSALSKAKGATGSGIKGLADLLVKAKEGLTYEQLAKKEPAAFMATYKALESKVIGMKLKGVSTPQTAESTLGIFQSPDGQKALAAAAKKSGMSAAELETIMGMYVFQSRYVPMATKAAASMSESFKLEKRIIAKVKRKINK